MFSFFYSVIALFYTPANYGFIPAHTTVCPSIKYYATMEEILNQKPTIVKKDKTHKKTTRLSKYKKRMIYENNKEKKYLANLMSQKKKDGDYGTYVTKLIEFYNSKLILAYTDYVSNNKNMDNLEHYVIVLNDSLNDEEMLFLKNKKHMFVIENLSMIIEGFELLIECIGIGPYDNLSIDMMSKLHDIIHV
jgi:hypothetical protein